MKGTLSNREFEVFLLVTKGITNKQVANEIFTSEKTVKFHLTNIYKKTACKSRHELIFKFYQQDLPQDLLKRMSAFEIKTRGFVEGSVKPMEVPLPPRSSDLPQGV